MSVQVRSLLVLLCFASTATLVLFTFNAHHPAVDYGLVVAGPPEDPQEPTVRKITRCLDRKSNPRIDQRGEFFVLYDLVAPKRTFSCHESVTYTTQGDYTFMDNLPSLVERWNGPVSLALYAPGDDFHRTLESVAYLRNCETPLIREFVSFHVFFVVGHFPQKNLGIPLTEAYEDIYDCSTAAPYHNASPVDLYRRKKNLTYPINVARNVARQAATTYFVFASDIELYPTPDFIPKFLGMISDHPEYSSRKNPRVYVLAVFEVPEDQMVPPNKTVLRRMAKTGKAFTFHRKLCAACHSIPKYKEWIRTPETEGLSVFTVGKRQHVNKVWEAFYVGTHEDPLFDERLSWEGQGNKMPQGYSLCLLNYDYMVLDNAFLVHKPGIKKNKEQLQKFAKLVSQSNVLMQRAIKPELQALYGNREGCYL